ncbi:DUF6261 family protein [Flavobacterium sp. SM2513]|uniref:DUF6261 family protein n=1 Tax=Flavobacterium sp. SM2513 TaxID=3424766 RepID=UPI003D7F3F4C
MFNSINLRQLRNAAYLQFMGLLIQLISDNDPVKLKIEAKLAQLQAQYDAFSALYLLPRGNKISKEIVALDLRRDNALVGFLAIVNGNTRSFIPKNKAAALLLDENLRKYGTEIADLNYQEQSTVITNLVDDWETETELKDALTLLDLDVWKDELDQSNKAFISAYIARTKELAEGSDENLRMIRVDFNQTYYTLLKWIESYATVDETKTYDTVVRQINMLIEQYNTLLNRGGGGDDEEEEDPIV